MKYTRAKNIGFTLIELLVVISIISLLSSVVLASVSASRNKAKISAYRSSLNEMILALELVKTNTGYYPGEIKDLKNNTGAFFVYRMERQSNGTTLFSSNESAPTGSFNFVSDLLPYLKTIPAPATNGKYTNYIQTGGSGPGNSIHRCAGYTKTPPFVIYTSETGFDDWPYLEYSNDGGLTWNISIFVRCYSPK